MDYYKKIYDILTEAYAMRAYRTAKSVIKKQRKGVPVSQGLRNAAIDVDAKDNRPDTRDRRNDTLYAGGQIPGHHNWSHIEGRTGRIGKKRK